MVPIKQKVDNRRTRKGVKGREEREEEGGGRIQREES